MRKMAIYKYDDYLVKRPSRKVIEKYMLFGGKIKNQYWFILTDKENMK